MVLLRRDDGSVPALWPCVVDLGSAVTLREVANLKLALRELGVDSRRAGFGMAGFAGRSDLPGPHQGRELELLHTELAKCLVSMCNAGRLQKLSYADPEGIAARRSLSRMALEGWM